MTGLNSKLTAWVPVISVDTTTGDIDKSKAVPANKDWLLQNVRVVYVSSSAAGNRRLGLEIQGINSTIYSELRVGASQAANLTRRYELNPGAIDASTFRSGILMTTLNPFLLKTGWKIRVFDSSTLGSTLDDMTVSIMTLERETSTAE